MSKRRWRTLYRSNAGCHGRVAEQRMLLTFGSLFAFRSWSSVQTGLQLFVLGEVRSRNSSGAALGSADIPGDTLLPHCPPAVENVKEVMKLYLENKCGVLVPTGELTVFLDGLFLEPGCLSNGTGTSPSASATSKYTRQSRFHFRLTLNHTTSSSFHSGQ